MTAHTIEGIGMPSLLTGLPWWVRCSCKWSDRGLPDPKLTDIHEPLDKSWSKHHGPQDKRFRRE